MTSYILIPFRRVVEFFQWRVERRKLQLKIFALENEVEYQKLRVHSWAEGWAESNAARKKAVLKNSLICATIRRLKGRR